MILATRMRSQIGTRSQIGSVAEHIGQGNLGMNYLAISPLIHAFDPSSTRGEVANHVTHVIIRSHDLNGHHRL